MRVVITGASYGLGKALAIKYGKNGYDLILIARSEEKLNEVKEELNNVKVDIYPYDLTKNPIELANKLVNTYTDIRILINNAGIGIAGDVINHNPIKENELIDLNIKALTDFSIIFGKHFKEKNIGSIINISSVASYLPGPYIASYYASKAYVSSFSYSMSLELKGTNVNVLAVNIPRVDTNFDKNANRVNKLKKGKNPNIIADKIYRLTNKRGIKNIGLETKLTNVINHIFPKSFLSKIIGKRLK